MPFLRNHRLLLSRLWIYQGTAFAVTLPLGRGFFKESFDDYFNSDSYIYVYLSIPP